ncbi:uncharacterized protein LOC113351923 [Papaver somniferum]|uniref:uncharacterized protein LOC113351923 n=1 Tax=Papaver somniferum TaxID=3469 RepID=UPI000E70480A|nr:uncharacterized protein LOC113351923 [Papaver somniferum]
MAASSDSQPSHDSPREPETSCRGKTDIAWMYAMEEKDPLTKTRSITCVVCLKNIIGGGINRLKKHLAGQRGEITPCKRVSLDVRYQMLESLKETSTKKRQREVKADDDQDNEVQEIEELMLDTVAAVGLGYKAPSYDDIRTKLLRSMVKEVRLFVESFSRFWEDTGCTIMADGWKDTSNRSLINFLVDCPKGTVFLKSVDASDMVKTGENLFNFLKEMVEIVGEQHVVQMVTDNASNYALAGRLLEEAFPNMYWTPCVAHSTCSKVVKISEPFVLVLRMVDSEDKPAMGFLYDSIIKYSEDMSKDPRIHSCVLDDIEIVAGYNQTLKDKFMKEKQTFQEATDWIIIIYMHVIYLWWRNFGCATPNLQKLAI